MPGQHKFGVVGVSRESLMARVHAGSKVNEVLRHYPRTGSVFLQAGPLFVDQPGSLYAQYPEQTIAEYADRNGIDVDSLLRSLNAEAEASLWEASRPMPRSRRRSWAPEGAIGYTGAYVELEHSNIETEPVVARQLARGPY
jgi:hypothetical protein